MIREIEANEEAIGRLLKADPIKRNQTLNTFIELLNSIEKNSVLALDGGWGSGKTVFVKQLEYLNHLPIDQINNLDAPVIEKYQEKYQVYYFNAWENDFHSDPLESILFNLINDIWTMKEKFGDTVVKYAGGLKKSLIKVSSGGLYDPQLIDQSKSISGLAKSIFTANERKKAIDDILNNHIDLNGKKLLFVIDELDRCKPTFAVELLEVIKHYYGNDKIIFLFSTNNDQLSHTIRKVYGQTFDGKGYLNKFYDLIFNLPSIPTKEYIKYLGHNPASSNWIDAAPYEISNHLEMSMRQINRYYSSLDLIRGFLAKNDGFSSNELPYLVVKYIMIPLAYGLRITDSEDYKKFVKGKGVDYLANYFDNSDTLKGVMERFTKSVEEITPRDKLIDVYHKLFDKQTPRTQQNYDYFEAIEEFERVVLLMNASGNIDEDTKEKE